LVADSSARRGCRGTVRSAGERAIVERFQELTRLQLDRDDRYHDLRPLTVRTVSDEALARIVHDVSRGDGNELAWTLRTDGSWRPPKLHSAYSSCGAAINTFGRWRLDPRALPLGGGGFDCCEFEVKLPVRTLESRRPPNLDMVLSDSERVVAVESKLLETLAEAKPAQYPTSYEAALASLDVDKSWNRLYREGHYDFCYVDVGQLVRHYLGLKTQLGEDGMFAGHSQARLLYVYWEPERDRHPIIERHRNEVETLLHDLHDREVAFEALTHRQLWHEWAQFSDEGTQQHVAELERRYAVRLSEIQTRSLL
jgi:hypothetical protein